MIGAGQSSTIKDCVEDWVRQVESLVQEYPTVFRKPDGVINRPGFEHKIELVENSTPPRKNAYRMTPRMLTELRKAHGTFGTRTHSAFQLALWCSYYFRGEERHGRAAHVH